MSAFNDGADKNRRLPWCFTVDERKQGARQLRTILKDSNFNKLFLFPMPAAR